eukprot:3990248-Ditylum_brightwellii.AAC.1
MGDIYKESVHGAELISPDNAVSIILVNIFADNNVTVTQLVNQMRHNSQLWLDLLWLSRDGMPHLQLQEPETTLCIKHANIGKTIPIEFKSVFNPHKMIRHHKAPAGTNTAQGENLQEKNK